MIKYLIYNKKRTILNIVSITLSTILLINIGIIFSSFREYMINNVKEQVGDYHVILDADINYNKNILKKTYKNKRYYIKYKNIKKTYENTENICKYTKCHSITYNDSLLSLYGISKEESILNVFIEIIITLVIILSVIIFFIIYNSFKVSLNDRKKDICTLKLIGADNIDIYKLIFKEILLLALIGIILGFILSIITNLLFIKFMNNLLFEIFKGKFKLKLYFPFLIIPIIFISNIIIFSGLLPLKNIKKYKPIQLFRENNKVLKNETKMYKNFIIWLAITNYKREKNKYKNLIICIFVSIVSVNIFSLVLSYSLKCINEYVIIPSYDIHIKTNSNIDEKIIYKDLKPIKKIKFNTCLKTANIPKKYFENDYNKKSNILITNIGGNEIINTVDKIKEKDGKLSHKKYKILKNINEIILNENQIKIENLKIENKKMFGFDEIKNIIINLDQEKFNNVCEEYDTNIILTTKYKGLDTYLEKLAKKEKIEMSYINVKKSREITYNIIYIIKIFLYYVYGLIIIIMIIATNNIMSISVKYRKKYLSLLQSLGLDFSKINISLLLESTIISFKGFFYALPFIFMFNKYFYISLKQIFDLNKMILNLDIIFITLIISIIINFTSMIISHKDLKKQSIIVNMKDEY